MPISSVRDANRVPAIFGVSSVDLTTPTPIKVNPLTGALLIDGTSLYTTLDTRYVARNNDDLGIETIGSGIGFVAKSAGQWYTRVLTGTSNRIDITNGSALATPTVDIAATYVGQSTITTLGTITTGTWNAGSITSTGNITVQDNATPTKAYRLRTSGTNLDFDATGTDLYISTYYPGGTFGGSQTQYMQFGAQFTFEKHYQKVIFVGSGGADGLVWDQGANTLSVVGSIKSSTTAGVGYATGAGGVITQASNKTTGVTLNTASGQITMNNAALGSGGIVSFTLTNSVIAATDVVIANIQSVGSLGSYQLLVERVSAGSCSIQLRNISGGSLSEAVVINFAVIKAVTS